MPPPAKRDLLCVQASLPPRARARADSVSQVSLFVTDVDLIPSWIGEEPHACSPASNFYAGRWCGAAGVVGGRAGDDLAADGAGGGGRGGRKSAPGFYLSFYPFCLRFLLLLLFIFLPLRSPLSAPPSLKGRCVSQREFSFRPKPKTATFPLLLEKMASHANVPLGRNFYVTSKGGGVSLLLIRDGKTKSHLGLEFRLLVGALHCLGKNAREIQAHQDFEGQVDMAEKDMQLAVVGSTYDGETVVGRYTDAQSRKLFDFILRRIHRRHPTTPTGRRGKLAIHQGWRESAHRVSAPPAAALFEGRGVRSAPAFCTQARVHRVVGLLWVNS